MTERTKSEVFAEMRAAPIGMKSPDRETIDALEAQLRGAPLAGEVAISASREDLERVLQLAAAFSHGDCHCHCEGCYRQ